MDEITAGLIVDGFAGPGGWSEGLRMLGLADIGIEFDPSACATRAAAGHLTIRADVTRMPLDRLVGKVSGLIMSPPCQAFSAAGKGDGRAELARLREAVSRGDWGVEATGAEVLEVGRWAETLRPTWIACEQVPPVLPLWESYAHRWRALYGWSCWAGLLLAADYGVPQTRTRAFLLVRTDGRPAPPPEATHCKGGASTMFGDLAPWVSMAQALGWDESWEAHRLRGAGMVERHGARAGTPASEPAPTGWAWQLNRRQQTDGIPVRPVGLGEPAPTLTGTAGAKSQWIWERPATTVCGDPRLSFPGHHDAEHRSMSAEDGSVRLTLAQALVLQSFRHDYPVAGTKTEQFTQVGNAVPPLLAAHVVAALMGP